MDLEYTLLLEQIPLHLIVDNRPHQIQKFNLYHVKSQKFSYDNTEEARSRHVMLPPCLLITPSFCSSNHCEWDALGIVKFPYGEQKFKSCWPVE